MNRRAQRIYVLAERQFSKTDNKTLSQSLRDWIGVITAGASIFAALLYLAGRSYATGYFESMNIPGYQVSFSIWEYGEVAWLPLLLYPVLMLFSCGCLAGVIGLIKEWVYDVFIKRLINRFIKWIFNFSLLVRLRKWLSQKIRLPAIHLPVLSKMTLDFLGMAFYAFYVLLFIAFVIFTLNFVRIYGQTIGKTNVLTNSVQVELVSTVPLALDDNQLSSMKASGKDYYVYKGFRLLTVNNGKYYLFKEINSETCKPVKVYIIESQQDLQVSLSSAVSLHGQCKQ